MKMLTIDPSINDLGWAIFEDKVLISFATIHAPIRTRKFPLEDRILFICDEVVNSTNSFFDTILVEKPQLWGAYKSIASAHSGSLLGLYLTVGALFTHLQKIGTNVSLIPVSMWKGQLSKEITKKTMEEKYQVIFKTSHEADAVGIGDWFLTSLGEKK